MPKKVEPQLPKGVDRKFANTTEVILWIWVLAGLGYFYYSQGFVTLLEQLWDQALG